MLHTKGPEKDCPECRRLKDLRKGPEKMPSSFKSSVRSELDKLIDKYQAEISNLTVVISTSEARIKDAEKGISTAKANIAERQTIVDALLAAGPRARGSLSYLASRTRENGIGHFIELFKDDTSKCSCEGGRYGGSCWAQDAIKRLRRQGDMSYSYGKGVSSFDARIKPDNFKGYFPTFADRVYRR